MAQMEVLSILVQLLLAYEVIMTTIRIWENSAEKWNLCQAMKDGKDFNVP
jgi:hypothetical protein